MRINNRRSTVLLVAARSTVLEDCVRETLDPTARRAMAVLDPIRVVITTWPEGEVDMLEAPMHPKLPELGMRAIPFSRTVLIERALAFEEAASGGSPGSTSRENGLVKAMRFGALLSVSCPRARPFPRLGCVRVFELN